MRYPLIASVLILTIGFVHAYGIELTDAGVYDHAAASYSIEIMLDRTSADAFNGRAWVLFKLGRHAIALDDVNQALKLDPNDANAYDTRGHVPEAMGRRAAVLVDFHRA